MQLLMCSVKLWYTLKQTLLGTRLPLFREFDGKTFTFRGMLNIVMSIFGSTDFVIMC